MNWIVRHTVTGIDEEWVKADSVEEAIAKAKDNIAANWDIQLDVQEVVLISAVERK